MSYSPRHEIVEPGSKVFYYNFRRPQGLSSDRRLPSTLSIVNETQSSLIVRKNRLVLGISRTISLSTVPHDSPFRHCPFRYDSKSRRDGLLPPGVPKNDISFLLVP